MNAQPPRGPRNLLGNPLALPRYQQGKWGYILAWLIGVPVPILVVIFLLRGCS